MTRSRLTAAAVTLAAIALLTHVTACDANGAGGGSNSTPTGAPSDDASDAASLESVLLPVITEQMEQMQIPGLIVVVQTPDRGSYEVALGVADVETEEPMALDMHVRIGSNTKTMTATVILQLVQEGELGLDDPLAPYFPGVDTNAATVRQALNMTSGIPTYSTNPFLNRLADDPAKIWTSDDLFATIAGRPPTFPTGDGWEYSNTNYLMLGLIAEQHGGASLGELITDRLFTPLQMSGCSMPAPDDATLPSPSPRGYQYSTLWDPEASPPGPVLPLVDVTDINPSWGFGAGEAICTAADMVIWADALVSGELLDEAMQDERFDFVTGGSLPYGLGVGDFGGLIGHNGQISGFQTQVTSRATDGTVIVVFTNVTQAPDLQLPATTLSALISRAIPAG